MKSNSYDVAIIGAGISGLIAGNYLAQSGLRVFIAEQHYVVGGCCSYFKRNGYTFECGAHSLGSCRNPDGYLYKIFNELGIYDVLDIKRAECSDTLISNKYTINFSGNADQMANSLAYEFKQYRDQIRSFFKEVEGFGAKSFLRYYSRYKSMTFDVFLSKYFDNVEIKEILSIFLGNIGVASNQISAITALALYREFVLDGGYYVEGGMKKLGDVLKNNFKKNGGVISLKDKTIKINMKDGCVSGVETERNGAIESIYVISTTGIKQTFLQLINEELMPNDFIRKVKNSKPSVSALILYLGLKGRTIKDLKWGRTVWYLPNLNPNEFHRKVFDGHCDENIEAMLMGFPSKYDESLVPHGCESLMCILSAPYKSNDFWDINKAKYKEAIINRISMLIPDIKGRIEVCELATPPTIFKFTLNDAGAIYGLASTRDQIDIDYMPFKSPVKNLFLSSHWTTQGYGQAGVPVVALAAKQVAFAIQKKEKQIKEHLLCKSQ